MNIIIAKKIPLFFLNSGSDGSFYPPVQQLCLMLSIGSQLKPFSHCFGEYITVVVVALLHLSRVSLSAVTVWAVLLVVVSRAHAKEGCNLHWVFPQI